MSKDNTKNTKSSSGKRSFFNKKASITLFVIMAIILILGTVFAFVSVEIGTTDYKAYVPNIKLGLDLEGGVYAVYQCARPTEGDGVNMTDEEFKAALNGTAENLQSLLYSKGFPEAQVSVTESNSQIRIEVPAVEDQDEIFDLIGRPASLEFYETDQEGNKVDASAKPYITGGDVKSANVTTQEGKYAIALEFNAKGAVKFKNATEALNGKYMGIFINKEFIMAPKVNSVIADGKAVIEGDYTYEQAYNYAVKIQSGAMDVKLTLLESDTISPTLGDNAKTSGLIAGGIGLLLIIIFMIARYRMLGVAAAISLCYFTITYLFFLSIFPWVQLTLPGIAGILLSIGMAVDANIIIFERVKESRREGKRLTESVDIGFKNSTSAIIDGNITTLIGAVVLWILGAAAIKGFAITLLIGIVISLFSSMIVTRILIKAMFSFNYVSDKLYGTTEAFIDFSLDSVQTEDDEDSEMQAMVSDSNTRADSSKVSAQAMVSEGKTI